MRIPIAFCLGLLSTSLVGSCGDDGGDPICQPACPGGTHCTDEGCVRDDNSAPPDFAVTPIDIAGVCVPACGGAAPYCSAGRCQPCVTDDHCPRGQICKVAGSTSLCVPGCASDQRCAAADAGVAGMACCGGECVDTNADARNCGGCGKVCGGLNSRDVCKNGQCVPGNCLPGWGDCNSDPADGCETNLHIDPKNCVTCGSVCKLPNAIVGCADGCYIASCQFGYDDCNGEMKDGCETSVISDVKNCGGCGMGCANAPHAQAACVNAACQLKQCDAGWTDCDGDPRNGCETQIASDVKNCGRCGNACGQGLVCINHSCTCPMCNIPNSKTKCVNNQCVFDQCLPGYADCDNNVQNGCEISIDTDPAHCGACGNVCPMNLPGCSQGQCVNGWFPVGVQTNVQAKMLAGWNECYRDKFATNNVSLASILMKCSGSKLMLACGKSADPSTIVALAWAPRADVTFMTGGQGAPAEVHVANGVGWYYNNSWSWGFVQGGDTPNNNSCDVAGGNPQFRMCWHCSGGNISGGYRCGSTAGLNGDNTWDRIIYQIP